MRVFGPLYDRVLDWSRHRHAERYLAALSFAESSFFPIPVDVMLAPMALADRERAWRFATVATIFSVLGGVAGYAIGYGAFEVIEPWLAGTKYWSDYEASREWLDKFGFWVIFIAGFSPLPYKVFTIAAGVAVINFPVFVIGSLVGRAGRFFLVAGLIKLGGEKLETSLRRYVEVIGWAVTAIVIVGIAIWLTVRG